MSNRVPVIVDISHHQRDIQFGALQDAGIEAVILKATDGANYVDDRFTEFVTRARSKGLLVGAYHFMSAQDPIEQLEHFLKTVKPYGPMVLALDYEANQFRGDPTEEILLAMAEGMVKRLGRHPLLYGSDGSYLGPLLRRKDCPKRLLNCRRWIARYGNKPPKTACDIWQYTSSGRLPNNPFNLDLNAFVSKEFATVADFWKRWAI
jgi:lysozyme